jgi:hypothetical protein
MNTIQQTKSAVHVKELEIAITFEQVQTDTCGIKGHSYETIDYIPDFDGQRYKLLIQCTDCGLETFEKINKDKDIYGEYEYPTTSILDRYWNKADEVSYLVRKQVFATGGIV